MIRTTLSFLLAAALSAAPVLQAAAPAASKERLRRLVHLPRLNFTLGAGLDPVYGIWLTADPAAAARELESLREALAGHSGDAARHARRGRLFEELGRLTEARREFRKAVDLYRQQGAELADDGALLAGFGTALMGAGSADEAERVLRRAVRVAPQDWKPQAALGRYLKRQALKTLMPASDSVPPDLLAAAFASGAVPDRPTPAQADKAQQQGDESLLCYDRAIALDPKDPEPYVGRAVARCSRSLIKALLDPGGGAAADSLGFARALYPAEALSDLRQAMRLSPKDAKAIGAAVMFEVYTTRLERGVFPLAAVGSNEHWTSLPEPTQQSVRDAIARIEELGQAADARQAAAALEVLGLVQAFVVGDGRGAETTLTRATELDPQRISSWETLVFLLASQKRREPLLTVCTARLKAEESARARLLLAKAHEQLEQWDDVLDTAATLQRRYPEDCYANLAFAAALLRTIDDELAFERAAQLLAKAEKLAGNSLTREQAVNLACLRGLLLGLTGQPEAASAQLKRVQELDTEHDGVREALAILERM